LVGSNYNNYKIKEVMVMNKLIHGDCLEELKKLESNSIDALVTDPPAGISFMGKDWDDDKGGRDNWIAWLKEVMIEVKRVLKPGAHGFVWALPKTSHWTAMALEYAGFEIRDCVYHVFGSGFPKGLNISKGIDRLKGAKREVIGKHPSIKGTGGHGDKGFLNKKHFNGNTDITAPSSPEAKTWDGFGSALKPAVEMWLMCRKPLEEPTIAKNVLKYGTGGINIDACRIGKEEITINGSGEDNMFKGKFKGEFENKHIGRFPSHLIHDGSKEVVDLFPNTIKQARCKSDNKSGRQDNYVGGKISKPVERKLYLDDNGGSASRFFYCAKPSKKERNLGCDELEEKKQSEYGSGGFSSANPKKTYNNNNHPTLKPQALMRYLITMITPPNGIVLDPFMGSGSTGVAAINLDFSFIGIEQQEEYIVIAKKRIEYAEKKQEPTLEQELAWLIGD